MDKKHIVITGGYGGIGVACAKLLLKNNYIPIILGKSKHTLPLELEESPQLEVDIKNFNDLKTVFNTITHRYGKISGLITCAGITFPTPVKNLTEQLVDDIIDTNLKGTIYTISAALEALDHNSSIVLVSSAAAKIGTKGFSVYNASKAALSALIKSLAAELIEHKIRINAILPGLVDTAMHEKLGITRQKIQQFAKKLPLQRAASPDEIAEAAAFLLSTKSSYINATEIVIDGGASSIFK